LVKSLHQQSDRVNTLQKSVSMSLDHHNKIVSGLVYGVLLGAYSSGSEHPDLLIQDLSCIVRDHYQHVIEILGLLIERCGDLLKEQTIKQMLILCEILISKNIPSVRIILLSLLRLVRPNFTDKKSVSFATQSFTVAADI